MTGNGTLQCVQITPQWEHAIADLFAALMKAGDEAFFHPHPLTREHAHVVANYSGRDLYYGMVEGRDVVGYGMLRGWDAGYTVPSLGIALHPDVRGAGLGSVLVQFLHAAAKRRGSDRVRLTVNEQNERAIVMYKRLGYKFEPQARDTLVGTLEL
ncbi:MAG: GNAT family N-acetyltransferase [Gemmatimonadaceae bacterium]